VNEAETDIILSLLKIIDFDKAPTICKVWKYFGLAPNTTEYSRTAKV